MITKAIGAVTFDLKRDFDFAFMREYGDPFIVFDKQDSGNLCFGVHAGDKKLFLKIAGAQPVRSRVDPPEAIERLRSTVALYEDLRHPNLTELIAHRRIEGGYLLVFDWFDGACMGRQYDSFDRFIALPLCKKLRIYDAILDFHQHANGLGYIAIDFYDGCIMYDFIARRTMLCDIEFYRKKPVVNDIGRMWGSSRYMSPEEFELGEEIDERSNVFCMGATAFELFGGGRDRSQAQWRAAQGLFDVAAKATNARRSDRFESICQYRRAWRNALGASY